MSAIKRKLMFLIDGVALRNRIDAVVLILSNEHYNC